MSISTNIDGSSGASSQLFDLLTVVSNPQAYQAKLKALEDATAESKKFVELVAPASEIIALKEKSKADAQEAADVLSEAKSKAQTVVADANRKAKDIVSEAQSEAEEAISGAAIVRAEADKLLTQAKAELAAAQKAKADAEQARASAESKAQELEQAIAEALKDPGFLGNSTDDKVISFMPGAQWEKSMEQARKGMQPLADTMPKN